MHVCDGRPVEVEYGMERLRKSSTYVIRAGSEMPPGWERLVDAILLIFWSSCALWQWLWVIAPTMGMGLVLLVIFTRLLEECRRREKGGAAEGHCLVDVSL